MFADTDLLAPDPILGLSKLFADDQRPTKIDLGVGVFRTKEGVTPIMKAVAEGEKRVTEKQASKVYTPADGAPGFGDAIMTLALGADHEAMKSGRSAAVQAPGGCGALRLAGELLTRVGASKIVIGAPTWPNHKPLLTAAGATIEMVPYYDAAASVVLFDQFKDAVSKLGPSDVLLLHGACHNPSGADLSHEQIDEIIAIAAERGFLVLIDSAYHGFAADLETDAYIIRAAAERLPEVLVTYSCSKNFGLYRERTGALIIIGEDRDRAAAVKSHALNIARANYSMPPAHGGAIVAEILGSPDLAGAWREELAAMAERVRANRKLLVEAASAHGLGNRLSYIASQNGMFSLLPTTVEQVTAMREKHGVYAVGAGRINLCGVHEDNVETLVSAVADVLS